MGFEKQLQKYAELLVKVGLNVQEKEPVYIQASIDASEFVHLVVEEAYKVGASDVKVKYKDDRISQLKYQYESEEFFEDVKQYDIDERMDYLNRKAAFLSIISSSPDSLKEADPKKISKAMAANGKAFKDYMVAVQSDHMSWCVASYPSVGWAKMMFPELDDQEAVNKLLETILKTVRVDQEDPVKAWEEHDRLLHEKANYLNQKKYKSLHYKSEGTDLTIELPTGQYWSGASSINSKGNSFVANMPTEEVFTAPHKNGVNGTVSNTLPLSYSGNIIDDFTLTFKNGEVVDYKAGVGEEILKSILETDEGAKRLGEVALVPVDSPISNMNTLFYNTLFDENASCHIALGSAYAFCIEGGKEMSAKELAENGLNDSTTHVDFMIGSKSLSIDGVLENGVKEPVFRDGNWAF
ncbi:aminopeptidase [Mammaliicoccus fleurettii]|uniref:Aminopeptidase n=1 Tax=Mammaliicoccus fleurettii TaxID=150056 RepID=A0ABS5MNR9_9STAP|nr:MULTISPECIES: aminopeptidase [Mammaliicoccus]MBL0846674.1 aminopeptidase [Mammaliicoccus fleurettii]MBS3672616.1 aminopeptidase [Mammaliicoccus fleurettii]MBS3697538.1 aminopeptidase [Mammaliicoccus fleurettii]MBW0765766.1 aminopeptidase [Mammaliicoccus fleurettii]MEB6201514.1 aminopeptidase [Mammaliicoccus fleurettii]